jgi:hypothetical protein
MSRYDDIDPMDIDPDTGRPYSNYSSAALDTSFHDNEMDDDDPAEIECDDPRGHKWVVSDENENICYCERCGCGEY